jgi:uncharacterized membrane protein YbhN (UPF0104 family)
MAFSFLKNLANGGNGSAAWQRTLKVALVLAGFVLFFYLILRMGVGTIVAQLAHFGWWFLAICALGALWLFFQTLAWRAMQRERFAGVSLFFLFNVKFISDALNTLLPSANLGGESARLYFTSRFLSKKEALAGVMVDKTFEYAGGIPFMIVGFLIGWAGGFFPRALVMPALLCLGITLAGILVFAGFLLQGMHSVLAKITCLVPPLRRLVEAKEKQIHALEHELRQLFAAPWPRVLAAWACHFLARVTGVFEVILVLRVLHVPVGFFQAFFITAMVTGVNTVFFLMPGQWGVAEGSHQFIVHSMGFPPLAGLSLGIIKRMRKLAFAAIGLLMYLCYRARMEDPAAFMKKSHD